MRHSKENRHCKGCDQTLRLTEFANAGVVKGVKYYRHLCKKCYYLRKKGERDEIIKQYRAWKETLACDGCGYSKKTHKNFTSYALEFHHYNSDKLFNISDGYTYGLRLNKIMEEAEKCIVLCCRCHIEEHQHNKRVYTKYISQDSKILKHKN